MCGAMLYKYVCHCAWHSLIVHRDEWLDADSWHHRTCSFGKCSAHDHSQRPPRWGESLSWSFLSWPDVRYVLRQLTQRSAATFATTMRWLIAARNRRTAAAIPIQRRISTTTNPNATQKNTMPAWRPYSIGTSRRRTLGDSIRNVSFTGGICSANIGIFGFRRRRSDGEVT